MRDAINQGSDATIPICTAKDGSSRMFGGTNGVLGGAKLPKEVDSVYAAP